MFVLQKAKEASNMNDYMRALRQRFYTPPGCEALNAEWEAAHGALSPYPRGEAQRSGFAAKRRRSGMDELSALAGSEEYGACADALAAFTGS